MTDHRRDPAVRVRTKGARSEASTRRPCVSPRAITGRPSAIARKVRAPRTGRASTGSSRSTVDISGETARTARWPRRLARQPRSIPVWARPQPRLMPPSLRGGRACQLTAPVRASCKPPPAGAYLRRRQTGGGGEQDTRQRPVGGRSTLLSVPWRAFPATGKEPTTTRSIGRPRGHATRLAVTRQRSPLVHSHLLCSHPLIPCQ
jgi:hypothetical protein